ncbi:hypothetical protein ABZ488_36575 [Streptomyces griseus]|uniref:hypothetical protein n=1 Tax=Streptomyces griseus TaxID=1911 RepID=UPI0033E3116D
MRGSDPRAFEEFRQSWCYSTGQWIALTDPLTDRETHTHAEMIRKAGFELWAAASEVYTLPPTLAVYSRSQEPSFLFDLEGHLTSQQFYARTLSDALVLLIQLAPRLRVPHASDQIAQAVSTWIPAGANPPRAGHPSGISG